MFLVLWCCCLVSLVVYGKIWSSFFSPVMMIVCLQVVPLGCFLPRLIITIAASVLSLSFSLSIYMHTHIHYSCSGGDVVAWWK